MKKIIPFVVLLVALFSCEKKSYDARNIAMVEQFNRAFEAQNANAIETLLSKDYYIVGPAVGDTIFRDDFIQRIRDNKENLIESIALKNPVIKAISVAEGDESEEWVVSWALGSVVYKNFDGPPVTFFINSNHMIQYGKIAKSLHFYDREDIMDQLGFIFSAPEDMATEEPISDEGNATDDTSE